MILRERPAGAGDNPDHPDYYRLYEPHLRQLIEAYSSDSSVQAQLLKFAFNYIEQGSSYRQVLQDIGLQTSITPEGQFSVRAQSLKVWKEQKLFGVGNYPVAGLSSESGEKIIDNLIDIYELALGAFLKKAAQYSELHMLGLIGGLSQKNGRLGMYQLGTNYVSAERNHMAAAIDDDNFFKPPSDIDMLCQPVSEEQKTTAEKILFTIAEVIFAEYGVLTQIHLSEPKKEKSFISFDDLNAAGGLKAFQKS